MVLPTFHIEWFTPFYRMAGTVDLFTDYSAYGKNVLTHYSNQVHAGHLLFVENRDFRPDPHNSSIRCFNVFKS